MAINLAAAQRVAVVGLFAMVAANVVVADDWPRFLGSHYDGISRERGWNKDWPVEGPRTLWRKNVGSGASSVAVMGDRLYTMGNQDDLDIIWCIDSATGTVLWRKEYSCKLDRRMFEGGPGATPTIANGRLFTLAHDGQLHCWGAEDGSPLWRRDLRDDFDGRRQQWGFCGSPLVTEGKLIIDNGGRGNSTIALDPATGQLLWASGSDKIGYASPVVARFGSHRVVLIMKATALVGLELDSGQELFRHPWETSYKVNAATAQVDGHRIFISSGYGRGCALLNVRDNGLELVYENKHMANQMDTSVIYEGHVYGISGDTNRGQLVCMALNDGRVKWTQGDTKTGTVALADGYLIVLSEKGGLLRVGPASPDGFKPTGRAVVFEGRSWSVPVLANGRLFAKNNDGDLVALEVRTP